MVKLVGDMEINTNLNVKIYLPINSHKTKIEKQVNMKEVRSENMYIPGEGFKILSWRKIKFTSDFKY